MTGDVELLRLVLDGDGMVRASMAADPVLVGDALGSFAMGADDVFTMVCTAMVHMLARMAQDDADLLLDTVREDSIDVRRSAMNANVNVS